MWNYEKRLQYPVKITQTNPQIAKVIISQFGGPDGELAASMRYLSQRYTMPYKEVTRNTYGYRHGGTGPYGNDLCHCASADEKSFSGRNLRDPGLLHTM